MKPFLSLALAGVFLASSWAQPLGIRGFLNKETAPELTLERQAQSIPDPARLRKYMNFIAGQPHAVGSARDKQVAEYILGQFKEWGLDAHIEEFEALMPYPTVRVVEVLGANPYKARLKEPAIKEDPDSADTGQLPTYNAYGASGDVTAPVVFANFGLPEDYEWLSKNGIDVKGKIVLTKYGKSWRGIKPKVAAEHGALACLIYSDPHEDGYFEGDTYPKGPMRPADGVQRGSVVDMPLYPGDPLSPGWASEKGSRRLPREEAKSLMKIPVLPISYADAQPILAQLDGPLAPKDWRGALALTYHAGPSAVQVHIKTDYDWTNKPLYDVIATIPGSELADEWIIAGNHHDAWVNGADDPVSGTVALMETARALATLSKEGWKPKRTILFAAWDGEEPGLLGSTEWAEKHQTELREKGVAYLNSDSNGKGWIRVSGSHTLEAFVAEVAGSVKQPGTYSNLRDYSLNHPPVADAEEPAGAAKKTKGFTLGALGAGSDYVAFLDFLGIASTNAGFGGLTKSGIYHSIYDSIAWYTRFSDGTFEDGAALSDFTATALLRLGNASVLPFEFSHFTKTVTGYLEDIQKEADKSGKKLDFSSIRTQLEALNTTGSRYEGLLKTITARDSLEDSRLKTLNQSLIRTERVLTRPEGLPNRDWYKHQIYAPGFYTGYGVKTLPGIREAVDSKDWDLAQKEVQVVEDCLKELNQVVSQAVSEASGI